MATYMRKYRDAVIAAGAVAIALIASPAMGEDDYYYTGQQSQYQQQMQQYKQGLTDRQYSLPNQYNGKYYPNDEPAIGYHGSSQSAAAGTKNDPTNAGHSYYYYYY